MIIKLHFVIFLFLFFHWGKWRGVGGTFFLSMTKCSSHCNMVVVMLKLLCSSENYLYSAYTLSASQNICAIQTGVL